MRAHDSTLRRLRMLASLVLLLSACRRAAGPDSRPNATTPAQPERRPPEAVPELPAGCELALTVNLDAVSGVKAMTDLVPTLLEAVAGEFLASLPQQGGELRQSIRRATVCRIGAARRNAQMVMLLSGPIPAGILQRAPWPPTDDMTTDGLLVRRRGGAFFAQKDGSLIVTSTESLLRASLLGPHAPYALDPAAMLAMVARAAALRDAIAGNHLVQIGELNAVRELALTVDASATTLEARATADDEDAARRLADGMTGLFAGLAAARPLAGQRLAFTARAVGAVVTLAGAIPPGWIERFAARTASQVPQALRHAAALRRAALAARADH
jgi:hypothetical protein